MLFHTSPAFCSYFGNAQDGLQPAAFAAYHGTDLSVQEPFIRLKKIMGLSSLVFLHQTHSDKGFVLQADADVAALESFVTEGDYLITSLKHVGIGVMTADCLPIVMYDVQNNVIAVVHAGWRGSVQRVAVRALEALQKNFATDTAQLRIFFGPSAHACCYQVQPDFIQNLDDFSFAQQTLQTHSGNLYFDLPLFNRLQLEAAGVPKQAFKMDYALCTMCDPTFCSYRRQGAAAGRQMTVVSLT